LIYTRIVITYLEKDEGALEYGYSPGATTACPILGEGEECSKDLPAGPGLKHNVVEIISSHLTPKTEVEGQGTKHCAKVPSCTAMPRMQRSL
jgi:hypothetical protein